MLEFVLKSQLEMVRTFDEFYKTSYANSYCDIMTDSMSYIEQQSTKYLMNMGRDWIKAKHSLLYIKE